MSSSAISHQSHHENFLKTLSRPGTVETSNPDTMRESPVGLELLTIGSSRSSRLCSGGTVLLFLNPSPLLKQALSEPYLVNATVKDLTMLVYDQLVQHDFWSFSNFLLPVR